MPAAYRPHQALHELELIVEDDIVCCRIVGVEVHEAVPKYVFAERPAILIRLQPQKAFLLGCVISEGVLFLADLYLFP